MANPSANTAPPLHDSVAISHYIQGVKAGDSRAAEVIFARYHERLLAAARRRIQGRGLPTKVTDEHDVAQSALGCFLRKARGGDFPELQNRDSLWRLLLVITTNKVREKQRRDRRPIFPAGQRIFGEADLRANAGEDDPTWDDCVSAMSAEPSPEMAAEIAEQTEAAMSRLRNEQLRTIATLRLQNFTHREIVEELDLSEKQVERKLKAIRETWESLAAGGGAQ